VNVVSFRGDGRLVALGSSAAIELWDIHTLTRVATMAEPDHTPMFTAFSPDGRHVVSACLDQRPDQQAIRLWDAPGAALKSRLSGHTLSAGYLVFSPDGRTLASGSLDSTIRLWDMETETCRVVINDHGSFVLGLAFSPDGRTLASCSADSTVRLWDARNGEAIAVLSGFEGWVQSVAFSPDGSALAGRNAQGQVRVWRMQDRDRRTLADHGADVFDVRFSADGAYLVSASWDGTIRLRNARTFETTRVFRGHTGPVWSADLTPDNRTLISCGSDGTRVWDVETAVQRARVKPNELTVSTRVSPDGARFALSLWKRVYVFDVATLAQLAECNIHDEVTTECDWSPDGTMLASTSLDGTVRLWNAADGKPLRVLARGLGRVASVAFHPDGRHVATGAEDRVVRVLDVETGAVTRSLEGHEDAIFNVRFSPDGNLLFSSSGDRSIRIWRYADASTVAVLKSQRETVTRLAVHPRGTHLASGSQDDTVRIWPLWVLNVARDTVRDWAQLQTGLMVPEKSFVARRLPTWPAGLRDDYGAHDLRREHVRLAGLYAEFAHARFEGWRCEDVTGPDGKPARRYFPPRTRGPDGKLSGPPRGRVNYAAWWEDRHAAQLRAAWPRAPVVTEVLSEGQARELGLAEGDLLLRVDGVEVGDREQLRRLLDERQDRSCIVAVLRLARDERGQPVAAVNEQGDLRLDETGRTYWDGRRFEVELKPGRLGMRVGDAVWPPRPAR
jgi:WD40 repeat protein